MWYYFSYTKAMHFYGMHAGQALLYLYGQLILDDYLVCFMGKNPVKG
jgi:hypothetical protein